MTRVIRALPFVVALPGMLLSARLTTGLRAEPGAASSEGRNPSVAGPTRVDPAALEDRRFQFSWKSKEGSGVNGIAWLKADGTIHGIGSPNETTWQVDQAGRLLFKHADGRVSTRYDRVERVDGRLRFEGPFLFREGITHLLVELTDRQAADGHRITADEAARIQYSNQRFIYLDPGESAGFRLQDGRERQIRLLSVREFKDTVINLTRRAEVRVEIDGQPLDLSCAPYVMPTKSAGLRIQADTTTAWLAMSKRVQFSVWDASEPIVDTNRFGFPLSGYRLFSHGLQAYNEPVHLGDRDGDPVGQRFHHNYGVDLAGYEGRQKVLSCIDGVVAQADPREGDLAIRDDRGFILYYGHLDSILSGIRVGTQVRRGQWVAMLGRRGASGNFSHLHVGACLAEADLAAGQLNRNLNLYPWLVTAYRAATGPALLAVAGPHQTARTGDRVLFDGRNSLIQASDTASFRWEFHDGTRAEGPVAEKVYGQPGCYMAALWVTDNRGRTDVDFCRVRVFSQPTPEDVIPTLFVTYRPSAEVRVDEPVNFRLWPQGMAMEGIRIDFGDGAITADYRPYSAITHKFAAPGIHIVTITGQARNLPVTQKVKVRVQD
jgi:hypothetical protein